MGDAKQLRRNFLWNTFGQIVYMVCHFLFGILILSLAGAEQSGIFTTAVSATEGHLMDGKLSGARALAVK